MLAAVLVGVPLLRLRGHYLALATLGLGIIVTVVATESDYLGATSGCSASRSRPSTGARTTRPRSTSGCCARRLARLAARAQCRREPGGRALGAVNDSEVAAETLGVDTFRLRVQVFVLSAAYAAWPVSRSRTGSPS
jgi:branched-chain amino acid transport system permease protein